MKVGKIDAKLTYIDSRGDHIFNAEMKYGSTSLSRIVIVKFTKRYSIECHTTCHNMEFAPELFVCEQVAGGWYVVIMELLMEYHTAHSLAGEYLLSSKTLKQVETLVKKVHDLGFVHGDLRLPNILVGPECSVKLVDFDWAGKIGEAIYPPLIIMNRKISWHPEVKFGAEIWPEHDLYMLSRVLNNLPKS